MIRLLKRLRQALRREDGTASVEFVLVIPVIMSIFMASFESGLFMTRSIMLDQAVDRTMRELRLGHYPIVDADVLKREICARTVILQECEDRITIELTRVNTSTFDLPAETIACVDRDEDINPVTAFQIGQQNDLMLVRVCVIQDAILPGTGIGLGLSVDAEGGYPLVTTSAFVTEPS